MNDTLQHHEFTAEWVNDEKGPAILLTQTWYDEPTTVVLHPWQLRAVCEHFGLIASDPAAAKHIATLERRLRLLSGRIEHLSYFLENHSDNKHSDLSYETTFARATADMVTEFVADFADRQAIAEPSERSPEHAKPETGTDTRQISIEA